MLKRALIIIVVVVGGFLAFAATRPDTYHVERSTKMDAPPDIVFARISDLKAWAVWSPWDKLDPHMKKTYEGADTGVGASYSWEGNNKVGKGKMTVTESTPISDIKFKLEFIQPFAAVANTGFHLAKDGDKAVTVTWAMDGNNNLMGKVFGIFMSMDKTIGKDFETGLSGLKAVVEPAAKKAAEDAAKAAKWAAEAEAAAKAEYEANMAKKAAEEAAAPKGKGKAKGKR